ncbi:MAG: hypothetical protein KBT50_01330 [Cycloclasticus sp.]|nr:hypothetical protein [Cycloclasticus sp.]
MSTTLQRFTKQTRSPLKLLLLAAIVFWAQLISIAHSAEHPFHKAQNSCQTFFTLGQSAHSPISSDFSLITPKFTTEVRSHASTKAYISRRAYRLQARAPPLSRLS